MKRQNPRTHNAGEHLDVFSFQAIKALLIYIAVPPPQHAAPGKCDKSTVKAQQLQNNTGNPDTHNRRLLQLFHVGHSIEMSLPLGPSPPNEFGINRVFQTWGFARLPPCFEEEAGKYWANIVERGERVKIVRDARLCWKLIMGMVNLSSRTFTSLCSIFLSSVSPNYYGLYWQLCWWITVTRLFLSFSFLQLVWVEVLPSLTQKVKICSGLVPGGNTYLKF